MHQIVGCGFDQFGTSLPAQISLHLGIQRIGLLPYLSNSDSLILSVLNMGFDQAV